MSRIMVVCGGDWQVDLVKTAKEQGHYVINSNLYKDSPAFAYADVGITADVLDKESNLNIAKKYMPDAIITDQSDIAVPTVAYLNNTLDLYGIGEKKAALFTNKYKMRIFCRDNGFPCPKFAKCMSLKEASEFLAQYKNIIIKPLNSQSSRGVHHVTTQQGLEAAFFDAQRYTQQSNTILAEEFIEGTEFTVEGIKLAENHSSLAVSQKKHYNDYPMVASRLHYSHSNNFFDYDKLKRQNDNLVEAMGLPFGITHAEYIFSKGEFYLVEIAARGGGTNISSRVVPFMTGVPLYSHLIDMALGKKICQDIFPLKKQYLDRQCTLSFFNFYPGQVKAICGKEYLSNESGILDWRINCNIGSIIGPPKDDSLRTGHYIAAGENWEKLKAIEKNVHQKVYIEYEKNN